MPEWKSSLYGSETAWITIAASILMGLAGVCLFIFAIKKEYFRDFEDAKYQVFWTDIDELVESSVEPNKDDSDQAPDRKDH